MKRLFPTALVAVFFLLTISGCYTKFHSPEPETGEQYSEEQDEIAYDYDDYDLFLEYYYPGNWFTSYYASPYFSYGNLYSPMWYAPWYYYGGRDYVRGGGYKSVRRRGLIYDNTPPPAPVYNPPAYTPQPVNPSGSNSNETRTKSSRPENNSRPSSDDDSGSDKPDKSKRKRR